MSGHLRLRQRNSKWKDPWKRCWFVLKAGGADGQPNENTKIKQQDMRITELNQINSVLMSNELLCISQNELKSSDEKEIILHSEDVFSEVCNTCLENADLDDCFSMDSTDQNSCSIVNRKFSEDSEYMFERDSEKLIENEESVFADVNNFAEMCHLENDSVLLKLQDDESKNEGTLKRSCCNQIIGLNGSFEVNQKLGAHHHHHQTETKNVQILPTTENSTTNHNKGWGKRPKA